MEGPTSKGEIGTIGPFLILKIKGSQGRELKTLAFGMRAKIIKEKEKEKV